MTITLPYGVRRVEKLNLDTGWETLLQDASNLLVEVLIDDESGLDGDVIQSD